LCHLMSLSDILSDDAPPDDDCVMLSDFSLVTFSLTTFVTVFPPYDSPGLYSIL